MLVAHPTFGAVVGNPTQPHALNSPLPWHESERFLSWPLRAQYLTWPQRQDVKALSSLPGSLPSSSDCGWPEAPPPYTPLELSFPSVLPVTLPRCRPAPLESWVLKGQKVNREQLCPKRRTIGRVLGSKMKISLPLCKEPALISTLQQIF